MSRFSELRLAISLEPAERKYQNINKERTHNYEHKANDKDDNRRPTLRRCVDQHDRNDVRDV